MMPAPCQVRASGKLTEWESIAMASVPPDPDFEIRIVEEAERRQPEALVGKAVPAMSRSAGITEEDAEFVIRRVLDGMPSFLSDQEKHDIGGPYSLDRLTRDN